MVTAKAGNAVARAGGGSAYARAGNTTAFAGGGFAHTSTGGSSSHSHNWWHWWKKKINDRVTIIDRDIRVPYDPPIEQFLHFQFQSSQFSRNNGIGNARVYANSAPTAIDEETLATVTAYARFDDVGGIGQATTSVFDSTMTQVPLEDFEGRTAWYHGHWKHIAWNGYEHPTVAHQKQFMLSHSVELNVPGTTSQDQEGFCYYDSHANFNISANTSVSLWFYPTDLSQISAETWRTLLYRRIDSSNYYAVLFKPADGKIYLFINETGAIVKRASTLTVDINEWNLVNFTYDPTSNTPTLFLNSNGTTSTPADTYTPPYTNDANMYLGGLPNQPNVRYTGLLDNFVFWSGRLLNSTEVNNMWTRGTII